MNAFITSEKIQKLINRVAAIPPTYFEEVGWTTACVYCDLDKSVAGKHSDECPYTLARQIQKEIIDANRISQDEKPGY